MGLIRVKSLLGYKTMLAGVSLYIRGTGCLHYQGIIIFLGYPEDGGSIPLRNVTKYHGHATRNNSWTARARGICITFYPENIIPLTCTIRE
jgi:hypothetical protein